MFIEIVTIAHWSGNALSTLCTCELIRKIRKIQKRDQRIVPHNYEGDYDILLKESGKVTMEIKRLGFLAIEVFKTVINLIPNYIKDKFTPKHPKKRPKDMLVKQNDTITYRDKSLKTLNPKVWNQLPAGIKSETSYTKSKKYVDTWFGP